MKSAKEIFELGDWGGADWRRIEDITTYTLCVFGETGDQPGSIEVYLEMAEHDGLVAYRWSEENGGEFGRLTLTRDEAIQEAIEHARKCDEAPDADELIEQILESGYFGEDADAGDIWDICKAATQYSCGYLLLPRGEVPAQPIGRMWTTNGYLQNAEYIKLPANHKSTACAASALLLAVSD